MDIYPKYKDANLNQQAVELLPEIVTFLASIASVGNHAYSDEDRNTSLTKLADEAENLKFRMGYGY